MELNKYIDHTCLKQGVTLAEIITLCTEATDNGFCAVCVPPYYVNYAKETIIEQKSDVKVCTVIGFPFGYSSLDNKLSEIEIAITDGVDEIDIVHNVSLVKDGDWDELESDMDELIAWVKFVCSENGMNIPTIKVILETGILTNEEIEKCCQIYSTMAIDFIKTSTGFATEKYSGIAFEEHKIQTVELMRSILPNSMQIKASGGIKSYKFAQHLIDAGATRLGCSSGTNLIQEQKSGFANNINSLY